MTSMWLPRVETKFRPKSPANQRACSSSSFGVRKGRKRAALINAGRTQYLCVAIGAGGNALIVATPPSGATQKSSGRCADCRRVSENVNPRWLAEVALQRRTECVGPDAPANFRRSVRHPRRAIVETRKGISVLCRLREQ
jgi:hypothetical protein